MTRDGLWWAETIAIEREHGARALEWVANCAAELEHVGDEAGVDRMREIWARLMQLAVDGPRQ